jgi:hypothetical protein
MAEMQQRWIKNIGSGLQTCRICGFAWTIVLKA